MLGDFFSSDGKRRGGRRFVSTGMRGVKQPNVTPAPTHPPLPSSSRCGSRDEESTWAMVGRRLARAIARRC